MNSLSDQKVAKIGLKKATPKSDPYFGAGYSDFYGYDFGQLLTITTSLEKFKIREKEVSNLESPTHLELYDQKKSLSSESESSGNEKVTIKFIFVNS